MSSIRNIRIWHPANESRGDRRTGRRKFHLVRDGRDTI